MQDLHTLQHEFVAWSGITLPLQIGTAQTSAILSGETGQKRARYFG